ncbi:ABC transporter substrate-binding protein [Actinomadura welshii]|uniref:ABC transporter substrate-binding protein n=1 Tax=Actinomadura welshii TaxID=3103817 RepID=UPI0004648261|nr:ABC transporter substrate-binding protein [Actinomadura madurae]
MPQTSLPLTRRALTRRTLLRSGALAGAGALTAPALAACGSGGAPGTARATGPAGPPRRGGTLRIAYLSTAADSIDPLKTSDYLSNARLLQVYEKLGLLGPGRKVRPLLYERVAHNPDGTEWTFTLKEGVKFADGRAMTAADVLASYVTQSRTQAAASLAMIDAGRSSAPDARTVRFVLTSPTADLDARFASGYFTVMPDGRTATKAERLNGSGPYRVESFTPGGRSVLVRRKDYWGGAGRGHPDRIEMLAVPDPSARMNALLAGQVDWADNVAFADARAQRGNARVVLHPAPAPDGLGWFLNATRPPFDDPRVRQAFRLAVDRNALVQATTFGLGKVGNDLWGVGLPWYATGLPQRSRDTARASALLKEAGKDRVTVRILASAMAPGLVEASRLVVDQVRDTGFDVQVTEMPVDQFYADPSKYYDYSAVTFSWTAPFPEIAQYLYIPKAPYNFGWNDPSWAERFQDAAGEFDAAARQRAYDRLQRELWDSGTDLVWGLVPKQSATSPGVGGAGAVIDPTAPDLGGVWLAG